MLAFNEDGLLPSGRPIITTVELFEDVFVNNFESEKRTALYQYYTDYVKALSAIVGSDFYQWINGSFVTQKENPNDFDVVSFINFDILDKYKKELKNFQYPNCVEKFNIDGYLVRVFDDNHPKKMIFQSDKLYWWHLFEKVKERKSNKKLKKGFIEIHHKEQHL